MRTIFITIVAWIALTVAAIVMTERVYGSPAVYDIQFTDVINLETRLQVLALRAELGKREPIPSAEPNSGTKLKTVRVLIDTPGGRVDIAREIGEAMIELKKAGHRIHCNIVKAYSAGFYIASLCTKRVAFADSTMRWHYVWYEYKGPMNIPIAEKIIENLAELQKEFDDVIRQSFKVTDKQFEHLKRHDITAPVGLFNELSPNWIEIYPVK